MDDEIKTQRKQWHKPELRVLVRSNPEEAVLQACRSTSLVTGSGRNRSECHYPNASCPGTCSAPAAS
jgi:hypothetical protein